MDQRHLQRYLRLPCGRRRCRLHLEPQFARLSADQLDQRSVSNRPGEAIFIKDLTSGAVLTPYGALSRRTDVAFETRHSQGVSTFLSVQDGLAIEVVQTVHRSLPVRYSRLTLRNDANETRRLRLYAYAEWVLGNNRARTAPFVVTQFDAEAGMMSATNPYSVDYAGRTAYLALSDTPTSHTGNRREFLGKTGASMHRSPSWRARRSPAERMWMATPAPPSRST